MLYQEELTVTVAGPITAIITEKRRVVYEEDTITIAFRV
jgi:hypothetical protein